METFSASLALCAWNSPVNGEFPSQRPVTRSFDVFFHLRLNKRLGKQSRRRWFETPSCSLWRHCNVSCFHILRLIKYGHNFADDILKLSFLKERYRYLIFYSNFPEICVRVHLTLYQRWFRQWLSVHQATSHEQNQWWSGLLTHISVTRPH